MFILLQTENLMKTLITWEGKKKKGEKTCQTFLADNWLKLFSPHFHSVLPSFLER
jgi:hypothetical protein